MPSGLLSWISNWIIITLHSFIHKIVEEKPSPGILRILLYSNGVRQGSVLSSPILFTIYINDLLDELKMAGVGCHRNQHFVGALCCADDIALLSPSPAIALVLFRSLLSPTISSLMLARLIAFSWTVKKDLCRKANFMLHAVSCCDPYIN